MLCNAWVATAVRYVEVNIVRIERMSVSVAKYSAGFTSEA